MVTPSDLAPLMARLSHGEKRVLLALQNLGDGVSPDAIVEAAGFKVLAEVMNAANWLVDKGLLSMRESTRRMVGLDVEGAEHAERGFPERRAVRFLIESPGARADVAALVKAGAIAPPETSITLGWLKRKGWADIEKAGASTILVLTPAGKAAKPGPDEALLSELGAGERPVEALDAKAYAELKGRKGILKERDVTARTLVLTDLGRRALGAGIELREEIGQLSSEHLATGAWKERDIRPYDVSAFAPRVHGGRPHPLTLIIEEIRDVFVELGFSEISTDYVESAFWNMDVLFIPQDHPAREMQDTFYLDNPASQPVDEAFARTIAAVHETGGDTGSTGWGGGFSLDTSKRALLRTHTTVGTIRHLAAHPREPCKVFSIGRVFRNEAMDATHLPEFHQIEGIVMEPGADFRMLVGVLKDFYRRMGFEGVKVRPSYYPYTEPSLDVAVRWGERWLELGGAGIFRPEVTLPIGVQDPVLAWGLGLERLAMLRLGLKDIRQLYVSDVDWLRDAPLRRVG